MSQTTPTLDPAIGTFHHSGSDSEAGGCSCPIHRNRSREPFTAPLGLAFADHVHVEPIPQQTAADIYAAHHSYMDGCPTVNLVHHGLYYQDELLGAITYRFPLLSKKAVRFDTDSELIPEPIDYDDLPGPIRGTARRVLPSIETGDVADRRVIAGDSFVEAARICLGVRMANLASAALARSQQRFVRETVPGLDADARYLMTFVRADYDGAMIRALRDKGWTCVGVSPPSQASNREETEIRKAWKWQFLCPIETVCEQTTIGSFG